METKQLSPSPHSTTEDQIPAAPTRQRTPRLHAVDGLRFFACLIVFFGHNGYPFAAWASLVSTPLIRIVSRGSVGVNYFFLVGGFILHVVYTRKPLVTWAQRWNFWLGRWARVYPAFLVSLVFQIPIIRLEWLECWTAAYAIGIFILDLLLLQAWTVPFVGGLDNYGWTISTFVLSWIIFPWLHEYTQRLAKRDASLLAVTCCMISIGLFFICWVMSDLLDFTQTFTWGCSGGYYVWYWVFRMFPPLRIPSFWLGMLLARLWLLHRDSADESADAAPEGSAVSLLRRIQAWPGWHYTGDASFVLTLTVMAAVPLAPCVGDVCGRVSYEVLFDTVLTPLQAATLLMAASERGLLGRLLATKVVSTLGTWSFSVYIYSIGLWSLGQLFDPAKTLTPPGGLLFQTVVLFGVGGLLYIYFEQPAAKYLTARFAASEEAHSQELSAAPATAGEDRLSLLAQEAAHAQYSATSGDATSPTPVPL